MIEALRIVAPDGAVTGARRAGDVGPGLVFVHGVGSTAAIWDAQLDAFGDRFRCLAIELRGNGALSDPDPASVSREGYVSDVLAVADASGLERFTLVGCSLGGVVAFELYKRAPQRLAAMLVADSFAHYPNARAYADGIIAAVRDADNMRIFAERRAAKLGMPPERFRVTIEQYACKSVACYVAATYATWTGDYRDLLPAIDIPVKVVCGERDLVTPRELSEEIVRGVRGATFAPIENAGHVSNADNPDRFNAVLNDFLLNLTA